MIKQVFTKLENRKELIFGILAIILIVVFTKSISPRRLQNDTFYTVTIGKLISENGIDMEDHFSWHEGLPYTYPHWLYDLAMYKIYNFGGWDAIYISTCIFSAILGISVYLTNSRISKNRVLAFLVTIAVMYLIKGYIAARAQLVTFILFIWLVYNIERLLSSDEKKSKRLLPSWTKNACMLLVVQTIIANLHIAVWPFTFVLYLPYIAEYIIACLIELVLYKKIQLFYLKTKTKKCSKKIEKLQSEIGKEKLAEKSQILNINSLKGKYELLTVKVNETEEKAQKIKEKREQGSSYKIVITKNKNTKWLILIMLISILTGFLTPLGKTPYVYTYLTMIGNTVKNINEHLPLTLIKNIPVVCTIIVVYGLLTFTKAKIKLADLFMLGGLTYLMFSSRRQQSMFALIGSIAFTRTVTNWMTTSLNYPPEKIVKKWVNIFTMFVCSALVILISFNLYKGIKNDAYISRSTYPVQASEWILKNLDVKKVKFYNEYNYGSYLLYKGIPVFVDSRADLYAPEFNTNTGDKKDGKDIFSDFVNCSNISSYYGDVFKKYGVTHVIVYKNSKMKMLIEKADSEKYEELYSDDYFVIYKSL